MPIKLNGATNGSIELDVPAAVGSDLQVTLPATAGTAIVKATDGSVDLGSVDIDSSGNVKIASEHLRFNTSGKGIIFGTDGGSNRPSIIGNYTSSSDNNIAFNVTGSERMRIDSSGVIDFTGPGYTAGSNSCFIKQDSSGEGYLFNRGNNDLLFGTNNTERMRIDNLGRLLVGATAAVSGADANGKVQVSQDVGSNTCILVAENTASSGNLSCIRARLRNSAPNSVFSAFLQCDDSGANRATIRSNGGLANYSANNANLSDRNAKKDISAAANTWDRVKEWEIVNYRYNDQPDDADLSLGVIAQQVNESCPEVVTVFQEAQEATETEPAQEERLGVKEQQMHWMAIKALQEAIAKIETLETKVAALEATP